MGAHGGPYWAGISNATPDGNKITYYKSGSSHFASYTYTSSGDFVARTVNNPVDALMVAGGGGAGGYVSGGGGGGGLVYSSSLFISQSGTTYTVVVGAGGASGTNPWERLGFNGSNSLINFSGVVTASQGGGGGGANNITGPASGSVGGCG